MLSVLRVSVLLVSGYLLLVSGYVLLVLGYLMCSVLLVYLICSLYRTWSL